MTQDGRGAADSLCAAEGLRAADGLRAAEGPGRFMGLVAGALLVVIGCGGADTGPGAEDTVDVLEAPLVLPEEGEPLSLFFPGPDDLLHAEERALQSEDDAAGVVARIAQEVLAGPTDALLVAPFKQPLTVAAVDIADDGTLFLDLQSVDGAPPPQTGSREEILALYSLVNSVVMNVEGATSVVLLWNGRQPATLSGHLDTSRPVQPDPTLIGVPVDDLKLELEILEQGDPR